MSSDIQDEVSRRIADEIVSLLASTDPETALTALQIAVGRFVATNNGDLLYTLENLKRGASDRYHVSRREIEHG
jgi:hypothetical protein